MQREGEDSDSEEEVRLNEGISLHVLAETFDAQPILDDFIGIDTSNIIPRSRRRAAMAAMNMPVASASRSDAAGPSRSKDDDDDDSDEDSEAEF